MTTSLKRMGKKSGVNIEHKEKRISRKRSRENQKGSHTKGKHIKAGTPRRGANKRIIH